MTSGKLWSSELFWWSETERLWTAEYSDLEPLGFEFAKVRPGSSGFCMQTPDGIRTFLLTKQRFRIDGPSREHLCDEFVSVEDPGMTAVIFND